MKTHWKKIMKISMLADVKTDEKNISILIQFIIIFTVLGNSFKISL
jgi:hypothetical protein